MYEFMHNLLSDKNSGVFTFEAFSLCHILYMLLIIGGIVLTILLFKNKSKEAKSKLVDVTVTLAFCLYVADFFLMPFSYGYIDIDKLPFHICTLMSVMCLFSRHTRLFGKFKTAFSIMGLVGALMYLSYPAGVASADGYSYRILQTVIYHGLMMAQGIFAIAFAESDLSKKTIKYDAIAICVTACWAFLGNTLYSGTLTKACDCIEGCTATVNFYSHDFNWFFVKHDALYVIPDDIDVYFTFFAMVITVFVMCLLIRLIGGSIIKAINKNKANDVDKEPALTKV